MAVLFDPEKDAINRAKHGISLARAEDFDFDAALYIVDDSQDYGELRIIAISFLDSRLSVFVFSPRSEDSFRAIMFREATKAGDEEI